MHNPSQIGRRPAQTKGNGRHAHMLDGGPGKEPPRIAPPPQSKGRHQQRRHPQHQQEGAGRNGAGMGAHHALGAQHGMHGGGQQQAREHGGDRHRPLGMGIGQPMVQRHQAGFGAIPHQQQDKGQVQKPRIRRRRPGAQRGEGQTGTRQRHLQHHCAEQRERDAHAAENKEFPGRLQRCTAARARHHDDRGQCRRLNRHPHEAQIIRQHGQHIGGAKTLEGGMVLAGMRNPFMRREHRSGEADNARHQHQRVVQRIKPQPSSAARLHQRHGQQRGGGKGDIQPMRHARQHGQNRGADCGDQNRPHQCRSPRWASSA